MAWPRGLGGRLCYGGDYNPEQWDRAVWAEDMRLMRQAGVNLVTVGVFAWSAAGAAQGRYEFGWLDEVLDLLHRDGIRVDLATPTASPPPWFSLAHPDALPVTADGVRLSHGSRDTYCPSAPAYRARRAGIATELGRAVRRPPGAGAVARAQRVRQPPATATTRRPRSGAGCATRYGDLDRLNQAWTTAFWSQRYAEWDADPAAAAPPSTWPIPTQVLDFRRFCSDELLACFTDQRDVLRPLSPDVPITTNFVLGSWVPVDHRRWAARGRPGRDRPLPRLGRARPGRRPRFAADRARGWAGGRPWLLMEQAPDLVYAGGRMVREAARAAYPAQPGPRRPRRARGAVLPVALGPGRCRAVPTPPWCRRPARTPGSSPRRRPGPAGQPRPGRRRRGAGPGAASRWSRTPTPAGPWRSPACPRPTLDREAVVAELHGALWRAGVTVDVVAATDDLARYRVVFVPAVFLLGRDEVAALESYVEHGGTAVVTWLSGVVDADNQVDPELLRHLLGVTVVERHPGPPSARTRARGRG